VASGQSAQACGEKCVQARLWFSSNVAGVAESEARVRWTGWTGWIGWMGWMGWVELGWNGEEWIVWRMRR